MHVLILGARAPACLEWARAFAAAGWRVTVADSLAYPLARASRAAHAFLRLPEPRTEPAGWIAAIDAAVGARGIDLVLPTCEEVFYLSHGLSRLTRCRVFTSDFALLHRLHHKGTFAALTAGWPVEAPETRLLATRSDLAALGSPRDWVLKPAYSRFASRTLIRPSEAALAVVLPTPAQPWVAQAFVDGAEHCSFSVLIDGRLRAHACYQPRYRIGRGSGIYFEAADPPAIREMIEHFGRVTGYSGQVGFDFIEGRDGRFRVLECNPRATSGVHMFDDQPAELVASLSAGEGVLVPTAGTRMIALAMVLFAAPTQGWSRAFWQDFGRARDVVLRDGDLGPLYAQVPGLLELVGRMATRRCGLLAASTADIEWDGQSLEP